MIFRNRPVHWRATCFCTKGTYLRQLRRQRKPEQAGGPAVSAERPTGGEPGRGTSKRRSGNCAMQSHRRNADAYWFGPRNTEGASSLRHTPRTRILSVCCLRLPKWTSIRAISAGNGPAKTASSLLAKQRFTSLTEARVACCRIHCVSGKSCAPPALTCNGWPRTRNCHGGSASSVRCGRAS